MTLHTEDEARQKRCPYKGGHLCDGSLCMKWEWKIGPPTQQELASYEETSDSTKWLGYCGAFGRPE